VQTFQNKLTGSTLYLFARYWTLLGWRVIIYDRYGAHKKFLDPLLQTSAASLLHYHPYTVFTQIFPVLYNTETLDTNSSEFKHYYDFEAAANGVTSKLVDTANIDSDKVKTYDESSIRT
jgi:hypothetical protein